MKVFYSIFFIAAFLLVAGCGEQKKQAEDTPEEEEEEMVEMPFDIKEDAKFEEYPSGLKVYVVKEGTGSIGTEKSKFQVMYHGMLMDGRIFDSSFQRNKIIQFSYGKVIKGWQEAITKMKEGSQFRIVVPTKLGYAEHGKGLVPPNADIMFDMHLIKVINE